MSRACLGNMSGEPIDRPMLQKLLDIHMQAAPLLELQAQLLGVKTIDPESLEAHVAVGVVERGHELAKIQGSGDGIDRCDNDRASLDDVHAMMPRFPGRNISLTIDHPPAVVGPELRSSLLSGLCPIFAPARRGGALEPTLSPGDLSRNRSRVESMSIVRSWHEMASGWHARTSGTVFAGAFGAIALAGYMAVQAPVPSNFDNVGISVVSTAATVPSENSVTSAVGIFVAGMAQGDEDVVWAFASEEDQAALGTEVAVYEAYADAFPQLTDVAEVHVGTVREEGDTPFVPVVLQDKAGATWVADFGFWMNDAGDWTLISLDIKPASDNSV